ncbi:Ser/Thr protein phosphatase [Tritrichomonas foetus]|uniref:Serine/threonine-protein phosphatase n=1 Tax=Tritrichomonas foetus TaxID=1144522 RepID=A0A1J4JKA4_9EUKA|nr:Ser/Thr protein phosphatase [Tritrichomonas foetus]|eukprot:OHS99041.1 Ser/Thr protein phosphatase [Tritrichomonas foetus]
MNDFNPDSIIETITAGNSVPEEQLVPLLIKLMEVLYTENNVLELTSPITICGDIHGQLYDLFELFDKATNKNGIGEQKFLFMGDYVDRGRFSIETFSYLAALKLKYSNQFFLLRGNHECRQVNQMYGFYNETQMIYGHAGIWTLCNDVFDLLPMAALIDGRIFSVHGGLSPKITLIESIALLNRQAELPSNGPLCDLCWSDPEETESWRENQRGAGWLFGGPQVKEFCFNNGLDFVTRSHQLAMEGYKWFFDKKLITVWSAPNYMYRSGNKACVMKYHPSEETPYDIVMFDPRPDSERKLPEDLPNSPYFL